MISERKRTLHKFHMFEKAFVIELPPQTVMEVFCADLPLPS